MRQKSAFGKFLMRHPLIKTAFPAFVCFCAMLFLHASYSNRPVLPSTDDIVQQFQSHDSSKPPTSLPIHAEQDAHHDEDDDADDDEDELDNDSDKTVTDEDVDANRAVHQVDHRDDDECMPYILYDKPIKTGSTSAMNAIWQYLASQNATQTHCNFATCSDIAQAVCDGILPRNHMISHIHGNAALLDCLRQKGFYIVTSIREPEQRWKSTFKFAKALNRTHYGIPTNSTYEEFVAKVPACALLHYYDRLGSRCGDQERPEKKLENRVRAIVKRFDEVMDLYGGSVGEVYNRMVPYLQNDNVSPDFDTEGALDESRLFGERMLYEQLLQRAKGGVQGARKLCKTLGQGDSLEPSGGWVWGNAPEGDTFVRSE